MRIHGKVTAWNAERGFGFAKRDDGLGDVFIHIKELRDRERAELAIGEAVEFDLGRNARDGRECALDVATGG